MTTESLRRKLKRAKAQEEAGYTFCSFGTCQARPEDGYRMCAKHRRVNREWKRKARGAKA